MVVEYKANCGLLRGVRSECVRSIEVEICAIIYKDEAFELRAAPYGWTFGWPL